MRTRQYILEAAEQLLQTKGLARLTNKEIAEAAGCAEGTLYKHFATKEALLLAAIEENVPQFLSTVDRGSRGGRSDWSWGNARRAGAGSLWIGRRRRLCRVHCGPIRSARTLTRNLELRRSRRRSGGSYDGVADAV